MNAAVLTEESFVESQSLDQLSNGILAEVLSVHAVDASVPQTVLRRLAEIGFIPGEHVTVIGRVTGGSPLAVRIGTSTFALRRQEARCIHVTTARA